MFLAKEETEKGGKETTNKETERETVRFEICMHIK